ncbi:hypothetical protein Tco_0158585 [Tanacetum coccineum]
MVQLFLIKMQIGNLRALPSSWNNVALIMRNKDGIDDLDIDDLYNNLKVFKADIKGSSGSSSNSQNVAFLSAEDTSSSNEINTANGVFTASGHNSQGQASSSSYTDDLMFSFFPNQLKSPHLDDEDLEQIDHDDLEEMDLKWQVLIKLRLNALTVTERAILQGNVEHQEIKGTRMEMQGIGAGTTPEGLYQWRPMANLSKDIQGAGSDTRPPMLDRTDFASWQQHIRLYCRGNEQSYFKGCQKISTLLSIITLMQEEKGGKKGKKREKIEWGKKKKNIWDNVNDAPRRVDSIEDRLTMHEVQVQLVMGELRTESGMLFQVKQRPGTTDECDAFDFDVGEAPTAQTMSMANLHLVDPMLYCEQHENSEIMTNIRNKLTVIKSVKVYLTEREQKIDEQLRIVITDRNIKEENLKKELHSVKLQLASTINHNKSMVEEVTSLKKDFKQKENKYLEEFLDMKALKEKVEDKLYKQDQSLQTVHMLCKPKPYYDELNKVAIGYKNPLCLTRAKQAQPALYNGHEIIKTNHVPAIVHNSEDTLEIAEITRKKMNDKMKNPECVQKKVKITPPDYSKENYLATFTPQKQLTPEQIFWSQDLIKMKVEALKTQATASRPIKALTVYPPNTPATLVPRVLPTKRNNWESGHLVYLKHLKKSVETLHEIVEEAKVERPLDSSLASACLYTKHSQELLEYVIDTFPKDLNT